MRALQQALHTTFGIDGSLDNIEFSGRTDLWIMRRIFARFGLPATPENFARYFDGYAAALPAELGHPSACVLPGVAGLLAAAASGGFAQGLLTGNLRRTAALKLGFHGLWERFPFGAFADDSEHRNELGPHALRRAREHTGWDFAASAVWVIGDTPHDIACGRAVGARTLAVATGQHTLAELAAHEPTALLPDLADAAAFWRLVG